MEDMSLAFDGIWRRLADGIYVPPLHVERMVEICRKNFEFLGIDVGREDLRRQVEAYIVANSKKET